MVNYITSKLYLIVKLLFSTCTQNPSASEFNEILGLLLSKLTWTKRKIQTYKSINAHLTKKALESWAFYINAITQSFKFCLVEESGVLQGCLGHRAVLHGERGQPRCKWRLLLHEVQYRQCVNTMAERG